MRESSLRQRLVPIALLVAILAGCATPDASVVGADRATVQSRYGAPAGTFPLAGGGERWIYPLGGLQQYVWAVDLDPAGRVAQVRQVRTMENFGRVRIGIDTEADILREFGTPRLVQPYPLVDLVGWRYPHVEINVWYSEMVIYFDREGIVRRTENGPDPRFGGGGDNLR